MFLSCFRSWRVVHWLEHIFSPFKSIQVVISKRSIMVKSTACDCWSGSGIRVLSIRQAMMHVAMRRTVTPILPSTVKLIVHTTHLETSGALNWSLWCCVQVHFELEHLTDDAFAAFAKVLQDSQESRVRMHLSGSTVSWRKVVNWCQLHVSSPALVSVNALFVLRFHFSEVAKLLLHGLPLEWSRLFGRH